MLYTVNVCTVSRETRNIDFNGKKEKSWLGLKRIQLKLEFFFHVKRVGDVNWQILARVWPGQWGHPQMGRFKYSLCFLTFEISRNYFPDTL